MAEKNFIGALRLKKKLVWIYKFEPLVAPDAFKFEGYMNYNYKSLLVSYTYLCVYLKIITLGTGIKCLHWPHSAVVNFFCDFLIMS